MTYGGNSFLFMGDAEAEVEEARNWQPADVLKVGHHGSKTSSTQNFIMQVMPSIAIIQVGYMDGYNISIKNDMFRFVDKLRDLSHSLKRFLKKESFKVNINNKNYNIIGKVGMYHIAIDITGSDVKINDLVYLDINPLHVDSKIRREYI